MSLEPTRVAYPSSYLGHAFLFLPLTCFLKTLSCPWYNRPLGARLHIYLGDKTAARPVWPIMNTGLTGFAWAVWFSLRVWTSLDFVAFFLASKACDGPQMSSLPFWESCLALNLGGTYEGIITIKQYTLKIFLNATRCNKRSLGQVCYVSKTSRYFKLIHKGFNNFCLP
jgi:hypothetical protein